MEDEIEAQACKFQRIENGIINDSNNNNKNIEILRRKNVGGISDNNFQSCWQQNNNSSRIVRVSRASGGKDRHSKVMTSKGLRDRRIRLSVTTAIQFYDLQDRLGYDQPSKAVDWLIKAASDPISELPSLNNTFPHTSSSDQIQQQGFEFDQSHNNNSNNNILNCLSKSACSSTSETSKGSEIRVNRVKAHERARERATKEKQNESSIVAQQQHQHISQTASFTELLTGGIGNSTNVTVPTRTRTSPNNGSVHEQIHQWSSNVTPMDYFSSGLLVGNSSNSRTHNQSCSTASSPSSGFSGQIQLGHSHSHSLPVSPFSSENENHSDQIQLQHFPFMSEHHLMPQQQVVTSSSSSPHQPSHGSDNYNLNFTISSSGLVGYNRGTLQSNSLLPHLQRFSSMDGSSTSSSNNLPFFIGASTPAAAAAPPTMDNNHQQHLQFSPLFDARLQLFYGDGSRHSDQKGKCNKN